MKIIVIILKTIKNINKKKMNQTDLLYTDLQENQ